MVSCKKDLLQKNSAENSGQTETDVVAETVLATDLQSRALAANCFQCHGTNGHASELEIAGMDAAEMKRKFNEFRADGAKENIMNVHALAYTDAEVQLLGNYFSQQ